LIEFKIGININQPVDIVNQALMEPANAPWWTSDLERFEVVHGEPGLTGSIAHLHYRQGGRSYIMEDVLEYAEPGRRYVSRVSGGGMVARVETTIEPSASRTELTVFWSGSGKSILAKLFFPFLRGMMTRRARSDLETFKNLVETHGAHFPERASATELF
jgi:hypothetical protein